MKKQRIGDIDLPKVTLHGPGGIHRNLTAQLALSWLVITLNCLRGSGQNRKQNKTTTKINHMSFGFWQAGLIQTWLSHCLTDNRQIISPHLIGVRVYVVYMHLCVQGVCMGKSQEDITLLYWCRPNSLETDYLTEPELGPTTLSKPSGSRSSANSAGVTGNHNCHQHHLTGY